MVEGWKSGGKCEGGRTSNPSWVPRWFSGWVMGILTRHSEEIQFQHPFHQYIIVCARGMSIQRQKGTYTAMSVVHACEELKYGLQQA